MNRYFGFQHFTATPLSAAGLIKHGFGSIFGLLAWLLSSPPMNAAEPLRDYPFKPVPFTAVHLEDDNFWAPRLATNRSRTIPYAFGQCEITGLVHLHHLGRHSPAGKIRKISPASLTT